MKAFVEFGRETSNTKSSLCASKSLCTPVLCWYHMLSLWYHSIYVLVPLGTPGTTLSVPVSLSASQNSAGTTCRVFGTTQSMCWYPWYPWYHSLCASGSLCTLVLYWHHMLILWFYSLYVLVPLGTLGTPGTTLSVPVSLSAPQYSAGTTC